MDNNNWYVMQIMTGREQVLSQLLNERIDSSILKECFVPMTKRLSQYRGSWNEREFVLFPGYLFVISDNIDEFYQKLKLIPEFTKILGNDGQGVLPLTTSDVSLVARFVNDDYVMEMSQGIIVNDRVKVMSGPLVGYEGNIVKIDRHKRICFIEVEFCGQLSRIKVGLEVIDRITE